MKNLARAFTLFILADFFSLPVVASDRLTEQRYHYEMAKQQLRAKKRDAFDEHYRQLEDYPLKVYLDYALASAHLKPLLKSEVEQFIREHSDSYLGDRLRQQYLQLLSDRKEWADFLYWYDNKTHSVSLRCKAIAARHAVNDRNALAEVGDVWLSPRSLPQACDSVIAAWMRSPYFDTDLVWQRFTGALAEGEMGLASYLKPKLAQADQRYAQLIWDLVQQPQRIAQFERYAEDTERMQFVITFGIGRYARQRPDKAFSYWERYEAARLFDTELARQTKVDLVNRLLRAGHIDQVQAIVAASPSLRDGTTIEGLLRKLLKEQRWQEVSSVITLLPEAKRQEDRWLYWAARASELSNTALPSTQMHYAALAKSRSFYGFLAADRLGQPYHLQHQPAEFSPEIIASLEARPSFRRAKELWLTGRSGEAYTEWYYALDRLSAKQLAAAGVMANNWGWYDRAIQAMIAGKHWDHLGVRFPLAYQKEITDAAASSSVKPTLIYAIARQESAMSELARSPAGARGLMQLMPATAEQTARKSGIPYRSEDLYRADHNVTLGTLYLNELLDLYSGNRILAAAAYNAGPHRVKQWIRETGRELPFDVWIETIPFRETRGYVQNVLTFAVIYSYRMGQPESLVTQAEATSKL